MLTFNSWFLIILAALTCTPHLYCCLPALFFAEQVYIITTSNCTVLYSVLQGRREYAAGCQSAGERKMNYSLICNVLALLVGFAWWMFIQQHLQQSYPLFFTMHDTNTANANFSIECSSCAALTLKCINCGDLNCVETVIFVH